MDDVMYLSRCQLMVNELTLSRVPPASPSTRANASSHFQIPSKWEFRYNSGGARAMARHLPLISGSKVRVLVRPPITPLLSSPGTWVTKRT
jgi:hypothetical protein